MKPLLVIDAFAGHGTVGRIFKDRGHKVVGFDLFARALKSPAWVIQADVLEIAKDPVAWCMKHLGGLPDHGAFSPPCNAFAVPSIGRMWEKDLDTLIPKHPTAILGLKLLAATAHIIRVLEAAALAEGKSFTFTIENPRAMMRRAIEAYHPWLGEPQEVAYSRFGPLGPVAVSVGPPLVYAQKATDIWTNLATWEPLMCHARPPKAPVGFSDYPGFEGIQFTYRDGKACHERAERGSRAGIQRIKGADGRALLPSGLSLAWCMAAELEHAILEA